MKGALLILDPGMGGTLQDRGRPGWMRYGMPSGGCMDRHAAWMANRLVGNQEQTPVLELLMQGACLQMLTDGWIAMTGANADPNLPMWQAHRVHENEILLLSQNISGVWSYLAIAGGFASPRFLGSASAYPRAGLGTRLKKNQILEMGESVVPAWPSQVGGKQAAWRERRAYSSPPPIRVWPGPQWEAFSPADQSCFFESQWKISSRSDRVGFRLVGPLLTSLQESMISEPMICGTVQITSGGQPIITMRDGPTMGGYPKLGVVDPEDMDWLAQCRPGQSIQFNLVSE